MCYVCDTLPLTILLHSVADDTSIDENVDGRNSHRRILRKQSYA